MTPSLSLDAEFNLGVGYEVTVTGTGNPTPNGTYRMHGLYDHTMYFRHIDGTFFIWFDSVEERWYITANLGDKTSGYWRKDGWRWLTGLISGGGGYTGASAIACDCNGPVDCAVDHPGGQTRVYLDTFLALTDGKTHDPSNWWSTLNGNVITPISVTDAATMSLYVTFAENFDESELLLSYNGRDPNFISTTGKLCSQFYGQRYYL